VATFVHFDKSMKKAVNPLTSAPHNSAARPVTHMIAEHIQKPHPGTEPNGEPVEAPAWCNLYFSRSGKSIIGKTLYSTETAARRAVGAYLKTCDYKYARDYNLCGENGKFHRSEFLHCIQVPCNRE
jgi:hypothetical protein